jgi:hypothetical protein
VRERSALILSDTYAGRLEAFDLLAAAGRARDGDSQALRQVAGTLDGASARFADAKVGVAFAAFADLVRIAALLVDWRRDVLEAKSDPERFKRGALERLALWRTEYENRPETADLAVAVQGVGEGLAIAEVGRLCLRLARLPLPIGVFGDVKKRPTVGRFARRQQDREREPPPELNVAFLSFTVDGEPADQIHFLTPHEMHDLEIEVRVSRWPDGMAELRLSPVSIEVAGAYEFPDFRLARPGGDPPFVMRQRGRATIKAAQALRAQPFEFRYAAEFWPKETEQPVSVVGHRTLRIESVDFRRSPLTGYPAMDQRLLGVRNNLRRLPAMPQEHLESAMTLAVLLAGLAARAVQDDLFPQPISEAEFQRHVRDELRRRPEIGAELEEHPHAGGGEADLSLRGVRLELKVEPTRRLELADCQPFVEQAAAYAVGSAKRLALLCVLDASPKDQAPFSAEDGVGVLHAESGLPVVTILIQGGLASPSTLSRRRTGANRADLRRPSKRTPAKSAKGLKPRIRGTTDKRQVLARQRTSPRATANREP